MTNMLRFEDFDGLTSETRNFAFGFKFIWGSERTCSDSQVASIRFDAPPADRIKL